MDKPAVVRDQVLIANAAQRGGEVLDGTSTAADVFLGDWSPFRGRSTTKMDFDPDRIAVIVGYYQGKMLSIMETVLGDGGKTWSWCQSPHYQGQRIRFNAVPSARFAPQVGAPAPVEWRQGEVWPIKVIALDDLIAGDAPFTETSVGRRAVLGDAVVTMDSNGSITVTIPAGHTVTVRTNA